MDGWPMASVLLFDSMTGFLVLAASTDVKMLPGKCSFGLVSRTFVHLCCAALYCFCCCFNLI